MNIREIELNDVYVLEGFTLEFVSEEGIVLVPFEKVTLSVGHKVNEWGVVSPPERILLAHTQGIYHELLKKEFQTAQDLNITLHLRGTAIYDKRRVQCKIKFGAVTGMQRDTLPELDDVFVRFVLKMVVVK